MSSNGALTVAYIECPHLSGYCRIVVVLRLRDIVHSRLTLLITGRCRYIVISSTGGIITASACIVIVDLTLRWLINIVPVAQLVSTVGVIIHFKVAFSSPKTVTIQKSRLATTDENIMTLANRLKAHTYILWTFARSFDRHLWFRTNQNNFSNFQKQIFFNTKQTIAKVLECTWVLLRKDIFQQWRKKVAHTIIKYNGKATTNRKHYKIDLMANALTCPWGWEKRGMSTNGLQNEPENNS